MHRKVTGYSAVVSGTIVSAALAIIPANDLHAEAFDADKIMNAMSSDERFAYIAGVVEGLAVARYMKDDKQKTGMTCIYGWFYDDKDTLRSIYAAFDRYPDYPPGSIVDVLVKQKCGE